jgi:hypothetical protein
MIHVKGVHREDLVKSLTRKMAPPLGKRYAGYTGSDS